MSTIKYISLSELASIIGDSIDATFMDIPIWVIAETSDIKNYYDRNYCFLSLVEKENTKVNAKLEAVIWRNSYHIINDFEKITKIKFDKNLKLLLQVSVNFNTQYGLKLNILNIDTNYTIGNIELERNLILEKLVKENEHIIAFDGDNYLTYNKKLELPPIIRNIALISAPNSDGQRDFVHELSNNKFSYQFKVHEFLTQIQGTAASESIIQQLNQIAKNKLNFDVVVIARGGGSQVDFGAFENYYLAQAIAGFNIPILTGIGHERNISIADMMCNHSLKTPTKVANFIVEQNHQFEIEISNSYQEILELALNGVNYEKNLLASTKKSIVDYSNRIIEHQKNILVNAELSIKLVSPQNILSRGFAIISHKNKIIIDGKSLKNDDKIEIKFMHETISATINKNN